MVIRHGIYIFAFIKGFNMNRIISDRLTELVALCKKYRVGTMYIFGSVNTDAFRPDSDLDFLISFKPELSIEEYTDNYFELQYELRRLFSREIDLVTENSLSNPYFIKGVEQTKQLIYAA